MPGRTEYRRRGGFTLLELMTVITIIAIFVGVMGVTLRGGGSESVGLQGSQATVTSLLTLVRGQAAVAGRNAALLVHADPSNPRRYLRYMVPVLRNEADTSWQPLSEGVFLPPGCYVVPYTTPTGSAIEAGADWTDGNSSALQQTVIQAINDAAVETWIGSIYNPRGTNGDSGRIVVATGRPGAPGTNPPFIFTNPDNVRGVSISAYGQLTLLSSRDDL